MNKPEFVAKDYIETLPLLPGVYRMLDKNGDILYVGKASQLKKRVSSYFQKSGLSPRIRLMVSHVANIETTVTTTEAEALLLENNLIKSLRPRYNILFRDDKTYPYIIFTNDEFPRLAYYRGAANKNYTNFGPYPNAGAAKEAIDLIQKIFRLRTCEESVFRNRTRACLLHQIHRCSAPCTGAISREAYLNDIKCAVQLLHGKYDEVEEALNAEMQYASERFEYEQAAILRDKLYALNTIQQKQFVESLSDTDADIVAAVELEGLLCVGMAMIRGGRHLGDQHFFPQNADGQPASEVLEAFISQHYLNSDVPGHILLNIELDINFITEILSSQAGRAIKISVPQTGEKRRWVEMAVKNAYLAIRQRNSLHAGQIQRLAQLREVLGIQELSRIECFDISHMMGEATVASCVVYDGMSMRNSEYRRYNITGISGGDDYAAMRQALLRRYQKVLEGGGKRPDLIMVDGGSGQLNVALSVMSDLGLGEIAILGVAKGKERKPGKEQLLLASQEKPLQLEADNPALHLIQQIRDEAHRFAITAHRAKRAKSRTDSVLEEIAGVGDKKRRSLLTFFGGLKGVREASVSELCQVEGINQALAESIYKFFHAD